MMLESGNSIWTYMQAQVKANTHSCKKLFTKQRCFLMIQECNDPLKNLCLHPKSIFVKGQEKNGFMKTQ